MLNWWCEGSPWRERDAIICDGAVRSGKTLCMGISFFCWAMARFDGEQLGLCGKTLGTVRRNVLREVLPALEELGFRCRELVSRNQVEVSFETTQTVVLAPETKAVTVVVQIQVEVGADAAAVSARVEAA